MGMGMVLVGHVLHTQNHILTVLHVKFHGETLRSLILRRHRRMHASGIEIHSTHMGLAVHGRPFPVA